MKKLLYCCLFIVAPVSSFSQAFSCENLLSILSQNDSKQEAQFSKKGFLSASQTKEGDTSVKVFKSDISSAGKKNADSTKRRIIKKACNNYLSLTYQTELADECNAIKRDLIKEGFYFLNGEDSVLDTTALLYQHHDITAAFNVEHVDTTTFYSFQFFQKSFPKSDQMYYADDLLNFTSHEYLTYFFGEENVKKDICFFSNDKIARCSVLFLNTNRQVVFIWEDEKNRRTISNLLIGGQQKLKSQQDYDKYIAESNWQLKSGIHAGMSLYELRSLHGANLKFYGGNALNTGEVLPENEGKIDFKKENVILGCMNCRDNKFSTANVISADDAMKDERILFVLSIVLNPAEK